MDVPDDFTRRIVEVFAGEGRAWLTRLPQIIEEYAARWDLRLGPPFPLGYNYVAPATRPGGEAAVLKAGVLRDEATREVEALRHWDGGGAARLLEADTEAGVFLIERVFPGTPLTQMDDDEEATRIGAGIMRRLRRPAPPSHGFPTLLDWARAFDELRARHGGGSGPLEPRLFERGVRLYHQLAGSQDEPIVLHGDLHHWNVLASDRDGWLAIDPHGVVGEPAFEVGTWLRNPMGSAGEADEARSLRRRPDLPRVLARRLDIFAEELGIERRRLRDWGIAMCVLSATWSDEAGHVEKAHESMAVAAVLESS
jgi:streptomycin 6-kinase